MQALSLLLFLKEKQTGKIKGCACINGVPQRKYIPKEEAALPTVSTESTFITAAIAAKEKRKVRQGCPNGTEGRAGRHDGADSAPNLQEIHDSGQERNANPVHEAAEGALWSDASEPVVPKEIEERVRGLRVLGKPT